MLNARLMARQPEPGARLPHGPLHRSTQITQDLPLVLWDGHAATALIAQVEGRVAAGARFVVLAAASPLGSGQDRALLEGWWRAARPRLNGNCAGWAIVIAGADMNPALLKQADTTSPIADFPIRACADRGEALWWLRTRFADAIAAARTPALG